MKKLLFATCLGAVLMMGSCKKDWVCQCDSSITGTSSDDIKDKTLSQARSECKAKEYDNAAGTNSCSLK